MSKPCWTPSELPFEKCFRPVCSPKFIVSARCLVSWLLCCPFRWPWQTRCCCLFEMMLPVIYCSATFCCPRSSPSWHHTWAVYLFYSTPTWAFFCLLMSFLWCRTVNTSLILFPSYFPHAWWRLLESIPCFPYHVFRFKCWQSMWLRVG